MMFDPSSRPWMISGTTNQRRSGAGKHRTGLAWRILARALRNEVPHVRHQHGAAKPCDQCLFAILTAARTVVTREPHHPVRPSGERWRAGDHSAPTLRHRRFLLPEHVALSDRAAHGCNLGRDHFGSPDTRSAHNVLSALSAMDNSGLAIRASSVDINRYATSATLKLCIKDNRMTLEIDTVIGS
jgi:hypothetical protein